MQEQHENSLYQRFLKGRSDSPKIDEWHHYFDVYHAAFASFRGKAPTVLEIGVQRGGSMRMWQEYFGSDAKIFGMDIDPACSAHALPNGKVFIGDQANPVFLRAAIDEMGPPDIVIDDGGHTMRQMIVSFETIYDSMRIPGVYLIADTHTAFWGQLTFIEALVPSLRRGRNHYLDAGRRTIYDFAFDRVRELQGWTGRAHDQRRLGMSPETRPRGLPVSEFCRTTESIGFHDSMIVFRRALRVEPWSDVR